MSPKHPEHPQTAQQSPRPTATPPVLRAVAACSHYYLSVPGISPALLSLAGFHPHSSLLNPPPHPSLPPSPPSPLLTSPHLTAHPSPSQPKRVARRCAGKEKLWRTEEEEETSGGERCPFGWRQHRRRSMPPTGLAREAERGPGLSQPLSSVL